MIRPPFPGNTAVTDLEVYSDAAPDGVRGGSPHLHTVSTEAYVVGAGSGVLHTLDFGDDGAPRLGHHPLQPGTVLWFSPGVIHRVENNGGLRVTAIMSNSGLPEAGDAVLTFPPAILSDAEAYVRAAALPDGDRSTQAAAAAARRNLAVEGFGILIADIDRRGADALIDFQARAVALVSARAADWRERFEATAAVTAEAAAQIDAVGRGSASHLASGRVAVPAGIDERTFGMCGLLRPTPSV